MSAHREHDERLVVIPVDAAESGELSPGVEPGNRCTTRPLAHKPDGGSGAPLAEQPTARNAVEGEQPEGAWLTHRGYRLPASVPGRVQPRFGVAFHQPDHPTLRYLTYRTQPALPDKPVRADIADLQAATATYADRPSAGEVHERVGIRVGLLGCAKPVQVRGACRLLVERVDVPALTARDDHGFADPSPAVPDGHSERPIRLDRGTNHTSGEHFRSEQLIGAAEHGIRAGCAP